MLKAEEEKTSMLSPRKMMGYSVTIFFQLRSPVCQMSSKMRSIFCINDISV